MVVHGAEITIEGEVLRITFENKESGFRIVKVAIVGRREPLAIVGVFPHVSIGGRVRVRGALENDKKHGEQMRAVSVTELTPNTAIGIEKYLGSGMIRGIGSKFAERIVAAFGTDTLRVLDEEPERLVEVEGLGKKRALALVDAWREQKSVREIMVFLQGHGASPALALRIFKKYGATAINVVSSDPFRLAIDVWGIGFRTADKIAHSLGIATDSDARIEAGILQSMRDAQDSGHTVRSEEQVRGAAENLLGISLHGRMERALTDLVLRGLIVRDVSREDSLELSETNAAETRLAKNLKRLLTSGSAPLSNAEDVLRRYEAKVGTTLAPEQRDAVLLAARASVLVVTGGPGVGKTTVVRAILHLFEAAHLSVKLAAPTGRAAKRMSEATSGEASTLHRLLEFEPRTMSFKRNDAAPIEAGAIVIDESSMVDVFMADALLRAIKDGTRLVLVGDVDQLASVGPGSVLRDIIRSERVPCVRLTKIFRQAEESLIVQNAHRINRGEAPAQPPKDADADFFLIDRKTPESARATIVELVSSRIPKRFGLDPIRDIQVLSPMIRGEAGTLSLNQALQAALNPNGIALQRGNSLFRVGDKVMQLRNDYDRNVWNGDVGIVSSVYVEEDSLVVAFDDGADRRDVVYEASALDELTLAYACTVHKSQGSEYPAVVIPLLTAHFVMLSRNLLYTGVTRGRRLVVLVADPRAVDLAVKSDRIDERQTRLAARLKEAGEA